MFVNTEAIFNDPRRRVPYRGLNLNLELSNSIVVVECLVDHQQALDGIGQDEGIVFVAALRMEERNKEGKAQANQLVLAFINSMRPDRSKQIY